MRFYAELNDFLSVDQRSAPISREFDVPGSVKDIIESTGVPHTEVDLIIVNGQSVDFDYHVDDGDHISVYPVFESFDISPIVKVRAQPLRTISFVADVHLGRLARFLRLLGFDTRYEQSWDDAGLADISSREGRILLTRDVNLLKHGSVTHGYYVRATDPRAQVVEVTRRFHLEGGMTPFTRCMVCNGELLQVEKADVADLLQPATRDHIDDYRRCSDCGNIYWKGAHEGDLRRIVQSVSSV